MNPKSTWKTIFVLLLLINFAAVLCLFGWLKTSNRLNRQRILTVMDTFSLTIDQQEVKEQKEAIEAENAKDIADRQLRAVAASDGLRTLDDQKTNAELHREIENQKRLRLERETHDLKNNLALVQELLAKERRQFDIDRVSFEKQRKTFLNQQLDEDFKKTVEQYELLKAKQVKQIFQQMLSQPGGQNQVVNFLAAMQPRKSKAVITEFKKPEEIIFIQCVGSRDTERTYCSGVCCMLALKNGKLLKEESKSKMELKEVPSDGQT